MKGGISSFNAVFLRLANDERISVWHFSLYMSMFHKWAIGGFQNPIHVSRSELMGLTHINSIVTYHKCISQLCAYGYIIYEPSYHPLYGSSIVLTAVPK